MLDTTTTDLKVVDSLPGKGMKEIKAGTFRKTTYSSTNDPGIVLWPPGNDQLAIIDLQNFEYDLVDGFLADDDLGYLPRSMKSCQRGRIVLSLGESKQSGDMTLIFWKKTKQGVSGGVKSKTVKSFGAQSRYYFDIVQSASFMELSNSGSQAVLICQAKDQQEYITSVSLDPISGLFKPLTKAKLHGPCNSFSKFPLKDVFVVATMSDIHIYMLTRDGFSRLHTYIGILGSRPVSMMQISNSSEVLLLEDTQQQPTPGRSQFIHVISLPTSV